MQHRQNVLSVYRKLLRTITATFASDTTQAAHARATAHTQFMDCRTLVQDKDILAKIKVAEQVEMMLRRNVVRGVKKDDSETYVLQITKDTEIGDNDSVKKKCPPVAMKQKGI